MSEVRVGKILGCKEKSKGRKEKERREAGVSGKKEGGTGSNGYSRINSSIMSSASEFPRHGEARDNKTERLGRNRATVVVTVVAIVLVDEGWRGCGGCTPARVIVRGNKI